MVEFIDDNTLRVWVANTDAIANNQIKRIKSNSETFSYYVGDLDPNRPRILEFIKNLGELKVSKENQQEVVAFLKEKVLPKYRNLYVDNMNYIESLDDFDEIGPIKMKITGERGYLAFDNDFNFDKVCKVKKMLFGDYMWFDIIRKSNGGMIQMGFDEDKIDEILTTKHKMDLKDLAKILKDKYKQGEHDGTQAVSFIWFGFKYADYLDSTTVKEILKRAELNDSFYTEINKGIRLTKILTDVGKEFISSDAEYDAANKIDNYLYYGVPGCGKSYTIETITKNIKTVRTVFHPDYTYSDFIGQIIPITIENNINYEFRPGAFLQALEMAFNTDKEVALVIEEINRGNASAIFGDVFQLLDRKTNGESQYPIFNKDAYEYLIDKVPEGIKHRYLIQENFIKIPENLLIYATMNTSDQNVFTLDTAFKRRWQMKYIPNDINKCSFKDKEICDTGVTWETFMTAVNNKIAEDSKSILNTEDKRLGAWFVKEDELDDRDVFAEKVLMYIWNDMAKMNRKDWFTVTTFDNLLTSFKENGMAVFKNYETLFNIKKKVNNR